MGIIVGSQLKKNELLQVAELEGKAFAAGICLMFLMFIFVVFAALLMCCKNKCWAVIVSTAFANSYSTVLSWVSHLFCSLPLVLD